MVVSLPTWRFFFAIAVLLAMRANCVAEDAVGTQERLLKSSDQWPQVDADKWNTVLSDTQRAWKQLKARTTPWRAHIVRTFRYLDLDDQAIKRQDHVELDLNGNAKCLLLTTKTGQNIEVVGTNERYAFRLQGTQSEGERRFEIRYVGDDQRQADQARDILFSPLKMTGFDALDLTQSDGFKIQRVQQGEGTDAHCMRFDFQSSYSPNEKTDVSGGYFIVDTALSCAICECRVETFDEKIHDADHHWFQVDTNRYVTNVGVVPVVSQSTSGFVGLPAHIQAAEEVQRLRPADLSNGDCSLSAYGFPEPVQFATSTSQSNKLMSFYILAAILFVAAWVFYWILPRPQVPDDDHVST